MSTCTVPECGRASDGRFCGPHRSRLHRTGSVQAAKPIVPRRPPNQLCSVEDCGRGAKAQGLCKAHYDRMTRLGDVLADVPVIVRQPGRDCAVEGCERKHWGEGYCRFHFRRVRRHGDPLLAWPKRVCAVVDCGRPVDGRGYCKTHYERLRRTGDVQAERPIPIKGGTCDLDGCNRPHYSLRLCVNHYTQLVGGPRRRALKVGAPGFATPEQISARIAFYGHRCWMCGAPWRQIDHVKPLSKGGSNWPANLRPACRPCNGRKNNRWEGVK